MGVPRANWNWRMQPIGQCDVSKSANGQEMHAHVKDMLMLTFPTGEFTVHKQSPSVSQSVRRR